VIRNIKLGLAVTAMIMPFFVFSYALADTLGQSMVFSVNKDFDEFDRSTISATLRHVGENAYFYVDDDHWNGLNFNARQEFLSDIRQLASEFDVNIYPTKTLFWGQEPKPGIDGDNRVIILLEQLKSNNGGYFSTANGYSKKLVPESNEREMMVVGIDSTTGSYAKVFLAHEFQHLISFNQKELLRSVNEEVWLNELRSEYSVTLVGYNGTFSGSSLEKRAKDFFNDPSNSITEWPNVSLDYASVALLGEYIGEEYGRNFLRDTLYTSLTGISSINSILNANNAGENFVNVFSNWLVASYVNDELLDSKFGYARTALKDLEAMPQRITMISSSDSDTFNYSLKPWQPYGHKFYINNALLNDKVAKLSPFIQPGFSFAYVDNLGRYSALGNDFYVTDPGGLEYFFVFPINSSKTSGFSSSESESVMSLTLSFENRAESIDFGSALKDGVLIKKQNEKEIYVIEGKYKRYLRSEIIALYGHLDAAKAMEVDEVTFHSYTTANYVRYVGGEEVYAVWPDGTKHWLNITPKQWDDSGRDWGAIFIINDLELNAYKTGANIVR